MTGETLVQIPNATVYQVERSTNAVTSIANGDLLIAYASSADNSGLEAKVSSLSWALARWVAALRFDDHTYAFQLPPPEGGTAAAAPVAGDAAGSAGPPPGALGHSHLGWCYYCLTLPADTPLELVSLLQAILASGTAYHHYQHLQPQAQPRPVPQPEGPQRHAEAEARGPQAAPQPEAGPSYGPGPAAGANKADRLAAGLQRGGQLAAAGVLAMATWAGAALQRGAEVAVTRMQPGDRHQPLSPCAQARLQRAKSVAASAAETSGKVVAAALSVTSQVAAHVAQRFSESDLGRRVNSARVGSATTEDVRKVGSAGVDAVEAVYDSLADAARVVLTHTRAAATLVATHKYGPGAGMATSAGLQVAQSAVEAGLNVYKLRPTALAKSALKGTARNVVLGNGSGGGSGNQMQTSDLQQPPQQPQQQPQPQAQAPPQQPQPAAPVQPHRPPPPPQSPHYHQQQQPPHPHYPLVFPVPVPVPASGGVAEAGAGSLSCWAPPGSTTAGAPSAPALNRTLSAAAPHAPVAAVSTLAALAGPPAHHSPGPGSLSGGAGGSGGSSGAAAAGSVVEGVPVTGPVVGQPVLVDYTPSVAALQDAAATGPGGSSGPGLPYPAVSTAQYAARYYPAVPRT